MTLPAKTAVAWDAECLYYVGVEQSGEDCVASECGRKLRRRVGYICEDCEIRPIFFKSDDYRKHRSAEHE